MQKKKWRLGVMMIIRRNDTYLLARKTGKQEWQFCAGGRDNSEDIFETLYREFEEELCTTFSKAVKRFTFSWVRREFEFPPKWKKFRGVFGQRQYIAIIDLKPNITLKPDNWEIEEIKYVKSTDLLKTLTHKDMKETLKEMKKLGEISC
jgi:8-oxo-dGTP pyrophosphatase MutT (NUDIX family)